MKSSFRIGAKAVTAADIFSTSQPTHQEMAASCNTLGLLISNGTPILKSIAATSKTVTHPWLLYILACTDEKLREGHAMTASVVQGLQELVSQRAAELAEMEIENRDWNPEVSWCIPDLFGFFGDLIALLNAGEESGELDTALFRARDINLAEGQVGPYHDLFSRDVGLLLSVLELMHCAGIPLQACLEKARVASSLRSEIDIAIGEIKNDATLSQALTKTNGQLAHPVLIALLEAGESRGDLEAVTLHRIVTQEPLAHQQMASDFA